MLEQKLESLVRVLRAAEARELTHRPQLSAVAGWMNAARERIRARHAERIGAVGRDVERRVEWIDFVRRIRERDRPQFALREATTPVGHFGAQTFQLVALGGFGTG